MQVRTVLLPFHPREEREEHKPERYLEVRYEGVVAHPEDTIRAVAAFLDLPYSPKMTTYHEGKRRSQHRRSAKKAWLPPTQGLRDWRTQMAQPEIALFEALAGDQLAQLGYERGAEVIPEAIEAMADVYRRSCFKPNGKPRRLPQRSADGSR